MRNISIDYFGSSLKEKTYFTLPRAGNPHIALRKFKIINKVTFEKEKKK